MKLNQVQVCLDPACEECYVGDCCPKCGSHHYFYLRKYYPPMYKFGGHYEPVSVHRHIPIQEELPFVQGYSSNPAGRVNSDTLSRELDTILTSIPDAINAGDKRGEEAGSRPQVGESSYSRGKLMAAICTLLKGGYWSNASSPSNLGSQVDKGTASRSRAKSDSWYTHPKDVYERELNFE